jgi:site-specific DNA-methyltransferase (adenine-specific)
MSNGLLRQDRKSEVFLVQGDCLEWMSEIPDGSVDMVMADPPYQTTNCHWDSMIPLEPMWEHLKRVIKPNGAIVMTASQPFTTTLIASNMKMFKYCWVWDKSRAVGFPNAKNKPMNKHEDVIVFSFGNCANRCKNRMTYNPQDLIEVNKRVSGIKTCVADSGGHRFGRPSHKAERIQQYTNFPNSVLSIKNEGNTVHPTQKPVALMEYLIKTYTNEGETVLDFAMGSGTTGVACKNLNRTFIGIELDEKYFEIASERIAKA